MNNSQRDWKLKLRYGNLTTPYKHFTVIAQGIAGELKEEFSCPPGNAFIGMKVWATNYDEAGDMVQSIGEQIGFTVTGKIEIFDTAPEEPLEEKPYRYDIKFTPFKS